jgi:ADP-ribose pyrophosphatase YjhB (NUDIX family)
MKVKVVCNALILDNEKFVLVKEAQKHVYGKWNIPGGHPDINENIFDAVIREVKEETNLDIKLDGIIGIYQHKSQLGNNVIKILFKASPIAGELRFQRGELLDAKWFSFEEFSKLTDDEIRTLDLRRVIEDYKTRDTQGLDFIRVEGF